MFPPAEVQRGIHLADYFDYERYGRELFAYDYQMGANNNVFLVL